MATWRGVARERFDTEQDARAEVITTWVGPGSGRLCSGCSRKIEFGEVEFEVELPNDLGIKPLRFHLACYGIWSGEKRME
jgi:hypothetical protein